MRRPQAVLCAIALAATVLACAPVVFLGKSFVSPQNQNQVVPLFYERCPVLPGYADCDWEHVRGADVSAMQWAFFPLTVAQERSLKQFGEFPLWNRYNSAGTTLIGQGQMMLGDPLQWLTWLAGTGSLAFDIRFVVLRALFAAALGFSVFAVTRAFLPAALVAFAAAFVGHFIFRVNHPAIFTLCYLPLILLAWLKLIYGEERRRLAWLLGLMAANWLVLNSGTAKEAYMAMVTLNALGAAHAIVERGRFGARFREYALLLAAAGVCFLLIAAPVWGSFLDALNHGTSKYAREPGVQQFGPGLMLGFADNVYYLMAYEGNYYASLNPFLFAGLVAGVLCGLRAQDRALRRAAIVLAAGCFALGALAYGLVPAAWLLQIPFVRNIVHINNTFTTILVVPACVLAGIGFAHLAGPEGAAQRRRTAVVLALTLALLLGFYLGEVWPAYLPDVLIYSGIIVAWTVLVPELVYRLGQRKLSRAGLVGGLVVAALLLGRGAQWPGQVLDLWVLNPKARVDLTARPHLLDRFAPVLATEPARVLGVDLALHPGYNATLALEAINGPDAIWNLRYHALCDALRLPVHKEGWRMRFGEGDIAAHAKALDFMGVGVLLSPSPLSPLDGQAYLGDDSRMSAYSRAHAWPRAFYTARAELYDELPGLARRITDGDGKPFVALERTAAEANPALGRLLAAAPAPIVKARDYALTNNMTSFTIDAPAAGLVYLGETDEPGDFVVTVNGAPASYVTANHAFKAVALDGPGTYRITFRYWPARLSLYLALAGAGLTLCVAILLLFWRRHARMPHPLHSRAA